MSDDQPTPPRAPYSSFQERLERDPLLKGVTDMLTSAILKLEMTPTEVREAAIYACIRAEYYRVRDLDRTRRFDPRVVSDGVSSALAEIEKLKRWLEECQPF
jgi:hypothetical protein